MKVPAFPEEPAGLALRVINKSVGPSTIYLCDYYSSALCTSLGASPQKKPRTSHHFAFVVFSPKATPEISNNITSQIHEQSGGAISVTLLLHKPTDLKHRANHWFFYSVLRDSHRLFLDTAAVPYLPYAGAPVRDVKGLRAYWLKCEAITSFHLDAVANSGHLDVGLIKIALLNVAAEQIALALVRTFLGYTPNSFGLGFLLRLCGHFTALPAQCFPKETPGQGRRYKMLSASPSMLRHWIHLDSSDDDVAILLDAAREFLSEAAKIINSKLNEIEREFLNTNNHEPTN